MVASVSSSGERCTVGSSSVEVLKPRSRTVRPASSTIRRSRTDSQERSQLAAGRSAGPTVVVSAATGMSNHSSDATTAKHHGQRGARPALRLAGAAAGAAASFSRRAWSHPRRRGGLAKKYS